MENIINLGNYIRRSNLESSQLELVNLRASQNSGCSPCVEIHKKDAEAAGVNSRRHKGITAWTEFPYHDDRERAALGWAELLTRIPEHKITDEMFESIGEYFDREDLTTLITTVIRTINNWKPKRNQ